MQSTESSPPANKLWRPFLLSIPREVREQILRGLLLFNGKIVPPLDSTHASLSPAVLRVNKQLHDEGVRILYDENQWVMLTFNFPGMAWGLKSSLEGYYDITRVLSTTGELPFERDPAVKIAIKSQKPITETDEKRGRQYFTLPLADAGSLFGSFLHTFSRSETENFEFAITFAQTTFRRQHCHDNILDHLADFRGISKVVVTSGGPSSVVTDIPTLMMTPVKHVAEVHARGINYQARADRAFALKEFEDARNMYWYGLAYVLYAQDTCITDGASTERGFVRQYLLSVKMDLLMGYEISTLRRTALKEAYDSFNWVLGLDPNLTSHQKAAAYYTRGLECKEQGEDKLAAFAFFQAYTLRPGWKELDRELDVLQSGSSMDSYEDLIQPTLGEYLWQWKLGGILSAFRYRCTEAGT